MFCRNKTLFKTQIWKTILLAYSPWRHCALMYNTKVLDLSSKFFWNTLQKAPKKPKFCSKKSFCFKNKFSKNCFQSKFCQICFWSWKFVFCSNKEKTVFKNSFQIGPKFFIWQIHRVSPHSYISQTFFFLCVCVRERERKSAAMGGVS